MKILKTKIVSKLRSEKRLLLNKFGGVDFSSSSSDVSLMRSPDAQNMFPDDKFNPVLRNGLKLFSSLGLPIFGIHRYAITEGTNFVVHAGCKLFIFDPRTGNYGEIMTTGNAQFSGMAQRRSVSFVMNDKLYILDGTNYFEYYSSYVKAVCDIAYVPTTMIGGTFYTDANNPGSGVSFEGVNYLSSKRKNSFYTTKLVYRQTAFTVDSIESSQAGQISISVKKNNVLTFTGFVIVSAGEDTDDIYGRVTYLAQNACVNGGLFGYTVNDLTHTVTIESNFDTDVYFDMGTTNATVSRAVVALGQNATKVYQLDTTPDSINSVKLNGVTLTNPSGYTVSTDKITLTAMPEDASGVDNLIVEFTKVVSGYPERIKYCRVFGIYGGQNDTRVFLGGNPYRRNSDFQSGLYDPTYFPDTGYTRVGSSSCAIMGYVKQFDTQIIIKQGNEQDSSLYLRAFSLSDDGKPIYSIEQGAAGVGSASKYCLAVVNDVPLFLSPFGVEAIIGTNVDQQRIVQRRSRFIDKKLATLDLSNAFAIEYNGYYFLADGGERLFIADGRQLSTNSAFEVQYEWYYWVLPFTVTSLLEYDKKLYLGDSTGNIYILKSAADSFLYADDLKFPEVGDNVEDLYINVLGYWTTPQMNMGSSQNFKTLSKMNLSLQSAINSGVKVSAIDENNNTTVLIDEITQNVVDKENFHRAFKKVRHFRSVQFKVENKPTDTSENAMGLSKIEMFYNYEGE